MIYRNFVIVPTYFKDFAYYHEDFDGSPDGNDNRRGTEDTIEDCKIAIDEWHLNNTSVVLTLTFEELQSVQFALAAIAAKTPTRELKSAGKKILQAMVEVQKDIDFERTYTTND